MVTPENGYYVVFNIYTLVNTAASGVSHFTMTLFNKLVKLWKRIKTNGGKITEKAKAQSNVRDIEVRRKVGDKKLSDKLLVKNSIPKAMPLHLSRLLVSSLNLHLRIFF